MLGVLFHTLLLHLYRLAPERFHQTTSDLLMEEVRQGMEENFTDPFSVRELADRYYMTPSHFIVRFKKYAGYPPSTTANAVGSLTHAVYCFAEIWDWGILRSNADSQISTAFCEVFARRCIFPPDNSASKPAWIPMNFERLSNP